VRAYAGADRDTLLTDLANTYVASGDLDAARPLLLRLAQGQSFSVPYVRRASSN